MDFISVLDFVPKFAWLLGLAIGFDTICRPGPKKIIFAFITKTSNIKFSEFESQIINSLVSIFLDEHNKVSPLRVGIYSVSCCVILTIIFSILRTNNYIFPERPITDFTWYKFAAASLIVGLLSAQLSFVSDLISLNITKYLFYGKKRSVLSLIWRWIVDYFFSVLVTFLPLIVIYTGAVYMIKGREALMLAEGIGPLFYGTLVSVTLSTLISVLQFTFIFVGIATRVTVGPGLFLLNNLLKLVDIEKFPISCIMVFWMVISFVSRNLIAGIMLFLT